MELNKLNQEHLFEKFHKEHKNGSIFIRDEAKRANLLSKVKGFAIIACASLFIAVTMAAIIFKF